MMTVLLSLILALVTGARIGAAKQRAEIVTDIAMNSALAEYHRELFEQYDLLFIDMSYGSPFANIVNTEERLRAYYHKNFLMDSAAGIIGATQLTPLGLDSVKIPRYSLATDNDCAVLRRQIISYMTGEPVEKAFEEAADNIVILKSNGYDTTDVEAMASENREKRRELLSGTGYTDEDIEEIPLIKIEEAKRKNPLMRCHPDPSSISTAAITPSIYLSGRAWSKGTGLDDDESFNAADLMLFDQYLFEKCGSYQTPKEEGRLKYQLEYIIAGKGSDYENLSSVTATLFFWREAANFAYIMTDETKCTQANTIGGIIALLTGCPEIKDVIKMSVLFAWSFGESVVDIRTLFEKKKVPLVKSKDSWELSLLSLPFFAFRTGKGTEGLDYEDYLRMLVLPEDIKKKTVRLADIMEMDIRKTEGNIDFRMDACLDCFSAEAVISLPAGGTATIVRDAGYEMKDGD